MFTSIKAGIRRLNPGCHAFFIMPVDIPLVRSFTIQRILAAAKKNSAGIIYPSFMNQRGHPPLIPSGLIPPILDWNEPGGLKSFLEMLRSLYLDAKRQGDMVTILMC
jgi:CTP:molybdopterin cytidylyltransferase MocA